MRQQLHPPTADHVEVMLAEALAQCAIWPTEYIDGVVYALARSVTPDGRVARTVPEPADQPPCPGRQREVDESAGARRSAGHRDGIASAVAWLMGATPVPPVHVVMTIPYATSGPVS